MSDMNDLIFVIEFYRPGFNVFEHRMLPPQSYGAWRTAGLGGIAKKWLSRIFNDTWLAETLDYKSVRVATGRGLESFLVPRSDI